MLLFARKENVNVDLIVKSNNISEKVVRVEQLENVTGVTVLV